MSDKNAKTPELSKQVLDATKDAKRLTAMGEEHADALGERVAQDLDHPELAGAIAALVRRAGARTTLVAGEFEASDRALTEEVADDDPPRQERDAAERDLRAGITEAREILTGLYGAAFLATVHLASQMPRDPAQLMRYAERARDALLKLDASKLPAPRIEVARVSPKKWAALLANPLGRLSSAQTTVEKEAAELTTARARRIRAEDAWSEHALRWESLLDGLLRFARMDEEADRVPRPVGATPAKSPDAPADPAAPPPDGSSTP